jgi:phosphoribosyl 1,2-cyclic phosphate phosphodiesterase
LKIKVLGSGTSQGIPVIGCKCKVCSSADDRDNRSRVSVIVEMDDNFKFLIDIGPDFRHQMLSNNLDDLDAILITHEHNDHIAGLDDVRPINFIQRKALPIFARPLVLEQIKQRFAYIFNSDYPGLPNIYCKAIEKDQIEINGHLIKIINVIHGQLPVIGFRINNFAYITDASIINEDELEKLKGLDVLFLNALHHRPHHSHFNLTQALEMADKISAKQTYLTHISHFMGLHKDVDAQLPAYINLAYDGLNINL